MKRLEFFVTIEELPDSSKDYRVGGALCYAATKELRAQYGDKVNVIVTPAQTVSVEINKPTAVSDPL